jgi:opine dehydrogenase
MRVAVLGAGSIAYGNAALLSSLGHEPVLWSPSGKSGQSIAKGETLTATGALAGSFKVAIAASAAEAIAGAGAVLFALPANGHRKAMDAAAPHLASGQVVIISSHTSFSGLYIARRIAERGLLDVPVVVWGTTVTAGRKTGDASVNVSTIRAKVDIATIPVSASEQGLKTCQALFGDRFVQRDDALAISLSNLNPQNHLGIALCNFTRMEHGETWGQNENNTDSVGRLLEALDAERLAIAEAAGYKVRTIREHYNLSFHVEPGPVGEMARQLAARGNGGNGPSTIDTRYVLEDAPFGLHPTVLLGKMAGRPATLHQAGVDIFSALYGRDFAAENDLIGDIGLEAMSLAELKALVRDGWAGRRAA